MPSPFHHRAALYPNDKTEALPTTALMGCGVFTLRPGDTTGTIQSADRGVEELFGLTRQELIGRPLAQLLDLEGDENDRPAHQPQEPTASEALHSALTHGQGFSGTFLFPGRDDQRGMHLTLSPSLNQAGEVIHLIGMCEAVTLGPAHPPAMADGQPVLPAIHGTPFEQLLEASFIGIALIQLNGDILDANQAFLNILNTTRENFFRNGPPSALTLHPPEDGPKLDVFRQQIATQSFATPQEVTYLRSDGSRACVLASGALLAGYPDITVAFVMDITPQKEQAAALIELEDKFRTIFDNTFNFTGLLSPDGILLEANQSALSFAGIRREDVIGKPVWETSWFSLSDETRNKVEASVHQAATGKFIRYEMEILGQDGQILPIDFSLKPIYDQHGQVKWLLPEGHDVIEQVAARKQIQQLTQQLAGEFNAAFEQAAVGMAQVAPSGKFIKVNRRLSEITGYSPAELLQKQFFDITHPEDRQRDEEGMRLVFSGLQPFYKTEKRYIRADGSITWVSLSVTPIRGANEQIHSCMEVIEDITDRIAYEQQLQESEDRFRSLAEALPLAVWTNDKNGDATYVNKAWREWTGSDLENNLGSKWQQYLHPDDRAKAVSEIFNPIKARRPYANVHYRLRRPDGTYRQCLDSGNPRLTESGEFIGFVGSVIDVTELMQSEAAATYRAKQQVAIAEMGQLALSETQISPFLQEVVERVASILSVPYCEILRTREPASNGTSLTRAAGIGWTESDTEDTLISLTRNCQSEFTFKSQGPVLFNDLEAETRFTPTEMLIKENIQSGITVAIRVNGESWGLLGAYAEQEHSFSPQDIYFFQSIANILSLNIQRIQADEALHTSEERLRAALDAAGSGTYQWIIGQPDVFWDENQLQLFGYPETYRAGHYPLQAFFDLIVEEDLPKVRAICDQLIREEITSFEMEYRIRRHDGEVRWLYDKGKMTLDQAGRPLFLTGSDKDITLRKDAELALKRSEANLRRMIDANIVGVMFWDLNGPILDANDKFLEMIGYSRAELEAGQLNWLDLTPPDWKEQDWNSQQEVLSTGVHQTMKKQYIHKDGSLVDVLIAGYRFEGSEDRGISIVMDITPMRRAERALAASEAKFRHVYEANIVGLLFWDVDGFIYEANDYFLNLVGYTREEIESGQLKWTNITAPEYKETDDFWIAEAMAHRPVLPYEKQYFHKDGHRVDVMITYTMLEGSDTRGVTVILDNTLQKEAELALKESEQRFRRLADASPNLVWSVDETGKLLYLNKASLTFQGSNSLEEALAGNWADHVHPDDLEFVHNEIQKALQNKALLRYEFRFKRYDGQYRWLLTSAGPSLMPDGRLYGLIGSAIDITDRKETEAALKRSESRFRRVVESNIIGIAFWNRDGKFTEANDYFLSLFGYTEAELKAGLIDWQAMTPLEFREKDQVALAEIATQGIATPYEKQFFHKDGRRIDVMVGSALFEDSQNEGVAFILDITETKEAERALARSEERFRQVMEAARDAHFDWDIINNKIYWNDQFYQLLGAKRGDVDTSLAGSLEWVHPEDRQTVVDLLQAHLADPSVRFETEFRMRHQSGEYRHWLAKGEALRDETGKPYRMVGVEIDMNEFRRAEDALVESEKRFRSMAEATPIMIWMTDAHGRAIFHNQAFLQYSGYTLERLQTESWEPLVHPDEVRRVQDELFHSMENRTLFRSEMRLKRHDGEYRWMLVNAAPRLLGNGELTGMIGSAVDIHERKLMEIELREAKNLAERANRQKSEFLAKMTHELRTPLNAVISYADMMKKGMAGELNEKQDRYVNNIGTSGRHLLAIVNDILDISKIEAGKLDLNIEPVAVEPFMADLQNVALELARPNGLSVSFEVEPDLQEIYADPVRIKQVFLNLLSNAVKFNRPHGQITIRLHRTPDMEWIHGEVEDTGIGIPPEKQGELFQEFYQVENEATRHFEGTGLGLALTRHLLRLHGGDICFESEPNVGSTFVFRIPRFPVQPLTQYTQSSAIVFPRKRQKN
jgi:PAS domain S-box-containing protein